MSTLGIDPGRNPLQWILEHALEIAAIFLFAAPPLLDFLGLAKFDHTTQGQMLAAGMALLLANFFIKGNAAVDPTAWALFTGLITAAAIIGTRFALHAPPTPAIWAVSIASFAGLTATLAISLNGRALPARTAAVAIVIIVAVSVSLTIAVPILYGKPDLWIFAIAAFIASSITLLLLFLNERIFQKRQAIMQHLLDDLGENRPGVSQADYSLLKMAAHKYSAKLYNGAPPPASPASEPPPESSPAASRWPLALSASAYLIFSVIGYMLLLTPICVVFGHDVGPGTGGSSCSSSWVTSALLWTSADKVEFKELLTTVSMAAVAFLGAHIFTLRFLFKAALNSELNQFKWIRGALHMLTGVIVGLILYRALRDLNVYAGALWLGVAFASGWIPDFALTTLFRQIKVNRLKSVDDDTMKEIATVPIEIIDGIDYDTRYRLEENNIIDVQSLATHNPVTLYVETPFGLAQIYDWILQAQLCLAVGPKGFVELKKIAIRTIFQLEDEVVGAPAGYARMIGNAMFAAATPERLKAITAAPAAGAAGGAVAAPAAPPDIDPAVVQYAVTKFCGDPYIVALRKLWKYIYD